MRLVCLDLEGVLVPEIWIAFAEATGIPELKRTTRDEPDYGKLMRFRLALLKDRGLKLKDIQNVISGMDPLEGAGEFVNALKERTQFVILSDTFSQFAKPLMAKIGYPTLLCNTLVIGPDGTITDYELRQEEGKRKAVEAFKSLNLKVFAAGDSFNDLAMIRAADAGCLFRPPASIKTQCGDLACTNAYGELLEEIDAFLGN